MPGFVQLVDDTGTITVQVPDTWTDIDTAPSPNADGTTHPSIAASPDLELARTTFDVPGVVFAAAQFTADPQSIVDQSGLTSGCASLAVVPYDILGFTGVAQEGSACGSAGTADWVMIVASPADQSFTAVVQVQTATAADQGALFTVMSTFGAVGGTAPTTPPPGTAPDPTAPPGSSATAR